MTLALIAFAAFCATIAGGLVALRFQDKLHLILGFSAGAVVGVAFFDLLPEALELATKKYLAPTVTAVTSLGFLLYMLLNRILYLHAHAHDEDAAPESPPSWLGAGSL